MRGILKDESVKRDCVFLSFFIVVLQNEELFCYSRSSSL